MDVSRISYCEYNFCYVSGIPQILQSIQDFAIGEISYVKAKLFLLDYWKHCRKGMGGSMETLPLFGNFFSERYRNVETMEGRWKTTLAEKICKFYVG